MQNYNLLDDKTIQLPSGVFAGVTSYVTYPKGELQGICLSEKNMLLTHLGELVPSYTETHRRKTKFSVEFHKNGMVKAIALDELQEITTPIGEFPAELVTFFDTGELKRFFPLDGKISGLWSEEEEKDLGIPLTFEFPFTKFSAIISGVGLYKSGSIRSITLFPGESLTVQTAHGEIPVKTGFSLYESGELESVEPESQVQVTTPIGLIKAFDADAVGINADKNSLVFDEEGKVIALTTVSTRIAVQTKDERLIIFEPKEVINPLDDETTIIEGLEIKFDYEKGTVSFGKHMQEKMFTIVENGFSVMPFDSDTLMCSSIDCASCSLGCNQSKASDAWESYSSRI